MFFKFLLELYRIKKALSSNKERAFGIYLISINAYIYKLLIYGRHLRTLKIKQFLFNS